MASRAFLVQKAQRNGRPSTFIVEKPCEAGASRKSFGANAVAKSTADGYTLLVSASVHRDQFRSSTRPFPMTWLKDFTPLMLLCDRSADREHHPPSVPANNFEGLLRSGAQGGPQKFTFSGAHHRSAWPATSPSSSSSGEGRPRTPLVVAYKGTGGPRLPIS